MRRGIFLPTEAATLRLGARLAAGLRRGSVVALVGPLGAGKTTLTRGLARGLGVDPRLVVSPTFVLAQRYPGRVGLVHLDLYRVGAKNDLDALGLEEWLGAPAADSVVVLEWADRFPELLRRSDLVVRLGFPPKGRGARPGRGRIARVAVKAPAPTPPRRTR